MMKFVSILSLVLFSVAGMEGAAAANQKDDLHQSQDQKGLPKALSNLSNFHQSQDQKDQASKPDVSDAQKGVWLLACIHVVLSGVTLFVNARIYGLSGARVFPIFPDSLNKDFVRWFFYWMGNGLLIVLWVTVIIWTSCHIYENYGEKAERKNSKVVALRNAVNRVILVTFIVLPVLGYFADAVTFVPYGTIPIPE